MNKKLLWLYILSGAVYFTQGIEGLPGLSLFFYLKEKLHFNASTIMYIGSITTLAWLIKPLLGIFIDNYLTKKKFIILSLLGSIFITFYFGLSAFLPLFILIVMLTLCNFNSAIRDISVDGIMCVDGKETNNCDKIQCFDDKTEILTENGWKKYNTILKTDKVLSLDLKTNQTSYQYIKNIYIYHYNGLMYRLKNARLNFLFSPNHRFFYGRDNAKHLFIDTIANLYNKNFKHHLELKQTFLWNGKNIEYIEFPEYNRTTKIYPKLKIKTDLWFEFLGWFLSEGCVFQNRKDSQISISQIKIDNRLKIKKLLNNMNIHYWETKSEILFNSYQIKQELLNQCYNGTTYIGQFKTIPKYIKKATPQQIKIFLTAFNLGDGWKRKKIHEIGYCTTSPFLFNDLQELILKSGCGISYKTIYRKNCLPLYIIHQLKADNSSFFCKDITKEKYNGIIWDIETIPYHSVFIRREGRAFWTGNSVQWISITIAGIFTGLLGGYIAEHYSYKIAYLLLIPIYLIILGIVLKYRTSVIKTSVTLDRNKIYHIGKNVFWNNLWENIKSYKELFINKQFLLGALFLFVYQFSPGFGTPLMFIERDIFHWSGSFMGILGAISSCFSIFGAILYFKFSKKINIKKCLFWSVFLVGLTNLCYLWFNPITAIIYSFIFSLLGMFIFLNTMTWMAKSTLSGKESTSFALLCSVNNLSGTLSTLTGAWLFPLIGLKTIIIIASLSAFLSLPILKKLDIK